MSFQMIRRGKSYSLRRGSVSETRWLKRLLLPVSFFHTIAPLLMWCVKVYELCSALCSNGSFRLLPKSANNCPSAVTITLTLWFVPSTSYLAPRLCRDDCKTHFTGPVFAVSFKSSHVISCNGDPLR